MNERLFYYLNLPFNSKLNKLYKIFIFAVLSIVVFGLMLYNTSLVETAKYAGFQLFFVFLPGMFVCRLLKLRFPNAEKIVLAYGVGISLTIIEYFVFYSLNLRMGLYFIGPIMSCVEIVLYTIQRKERGTNAGEKNSGFPIQLWFIFSLILLVAFFGFTLANPLPDKLGNYTYGQDLLWTVGNTEALLRQFPPYDSRLSFIPFKYHYFISVYMAVTSYVTKIDPTIVFFKLAPVGRLFLVVFSAYVLGSAYFNSAKKAVYFVWIYLFTSCASLKGILRNGYGLYLNTNFLHLTNNAFGYEMSISFLFLCTALIIKQFRNEKLNFSYLMLSCLFIFSATGSKGPLGAVLIAVLLVIVLILILQKRINKTIAIYALTVLCVFILVYMPLLSGGGGELGIDIGYTVMNSKLGQVITHFTSDPSKMKLLSIAGIPVHLVLYLPFGAVLFLAWLFNKIKTFNRLEISEYLLGGMGLCGISAAYILNQDGNSQLYFIMAAIPFMELCAIEWLSLKYNKLGNAFKFIIAGLFIAASISSLFACLYQFRLGEAALKDVVSKKAASAEPDWNRITTYEYEGLQWLKNNTDPMDIAAGDRYFYGGGKSFDGARYFYYSAFSERQFYLEGWSYHFKKASDELNNRIDFMNDLYKADKLTPDIINKLKENKIKYVIVSRFSNPDLDFQSDDLTKCFENRDMKIYRVR